MPRKPPPPGYLTATQARQRLKLSSEGMLYKYVERGLLHKFIPPWNTKQGFYDEKEIAALEHAEEVFYQAAQTPLESETDAVFMQATEQDMPALVAQARKHFSRTIDADLRQKWMKAERWGNYVVKKKSGEVVAYCYLQALEHEKLLAYQAGAIRGWQIQPEDILPWRPGVPLEIMIGGIAADPDDHTLQTHYSAVLLRGIIRDLERIGQQGIIFKQIYAYSETQYGIAMCNWLGMKQWQPPKGKRCTFVLDVERSSSFLLAGYKRGIAQWKQTHPDLLTTTTKVTQVSAPAPARASRPVATERPLPESGTQADGLEIATLFAQRHFPIQPDEDRKKYTDQISRLLQTLRENGSVPMIEGKYKVGRAVASWALDQPGMHAFYEATHKREGFEECPACPH